MEKFYLISMDSKMVTVILAIVLIVSQETQRGKRG